MTPQEVKLWNWLREEIVPAGHRMRRQVPIDGMIVDFACLSASLVIEVDGEQHGQASGRAKDAARDAHLARRGYRVVRFTNREIDREKRMVLDTILARLTGCLDRGRVSELPHRSPSATPSPAGEGSGVAPSAAPSGPYIE